MLEYSVEGMSNLTIERRQDMIRNSQRAYARGRSFLEEIKEDMGCQSCALHLPGCALDFHHADPATKSFSFGGNACRALSSLWAEVQKCVVLCANCHRLVEWGGQRCPELVW